MQTPSEVQTAPSGNWTPRTATARRSVFGNYLGAEAGPGAGTPGTAGSGMTRARSAVEARPAATTLQGGIDQAVARSFVYRYLAKAYEDPTPEGWAWLRDPGIRASLRSAITTLGLAAPEEPIAGGGDECEEQARAYRAFADAWLEAFGHAARGGCPANEIEYGDIKADPLFQPHRLADLAAFYRVFGLEVAEDAGERQDHICLQLEFMCVLSAKEAYALEHQLDTDQLELGRAAQERFLREHLGRWTPAFTRRLAAATADPCLRRLAEFTRAYVEAECARAGVPAGSGDLLLRPVDEAAETLCASCGMDATPPGATPGA